MIKADKEFARGMFGIAGKAAPVTGGAGAPGGAIAQAYVYRGAKAVLTARSYYAAGGCRAN